MKAISINHYQEILRLKSNSYSPLLNYDNHKKEKLVEIYSVDIKGFVLG